MLKTALGLVKRGAQRLGIAISRCPPPGSFERHLRDCLLQMDINVVLDVGAYIGNYARELREVGYRGQIISFEPVQASYEQLRAAMHNDSLWFGEPFGLSDEDREARINTHSCGKFNSLLTLRQDAERAYSLDPARRSQAPIKLRRLDGVLPQLVEGIRSPRIFMKIDTQGHDVSVFKGASAVLGMIVGLQSELPAVEIYDGMFSMSAMLSYYAGCGFVPIGFYPVNTFHNLRISPEFDVLFSRFEGSLHRPQQPEVELIF
jgi:FkbM family methyltransferase